MAHVADVDRSVEFYTLLGFNCDSRFCIHDGITNFASLSSGKASIMLVRADAPLVPGHEGVIFYMYSPDVMALRMHLLKNGLVDGGKPPSEYKTGEHPEPFPGAMTVFRPSFPFYMSEGEIRIHDPDGYVILVGQLER